MPKTKRSKKPFSKRFYDLPEEEVQAIIAAAQSGNQQEMERLLEVFGNFLTKYVNIIYYGKFSFEDADVKRFLSLFIKDKTLRIHMNRGTLNPEARKAINDIIGGIRYMVQRYGTKEDVEQTVAMSFIQCVSRYKRKGTIPFSGFIYSYFYFMLKKNIDVYLIDQLGLKTFPLITEIDSSGESDQAQPGYYAPVVEQELLSLIPEEINDEWVAGDTAMPPFDRLTHHQRQLIRWRYIMGETASAISDRVSEHPNTVRDHFKKIRSSLKDAIHQDIG